MNVRVRVCLREERLACAVKAALRFAGFAVEGTEPPALTVTDEAFLKDVPMQEEVGGRVLLLYRGGSPPDDGSRDRRAALRLPFSLEGEGGLAEAVRRLITEEAAAGSEAVEPAVFVPEQDVEAEPFIEPSAGDGAPAGLSLDSEAGTASRGGETVHLSAREFALLSYLSFHAGEVVSREALREAVWRGEADSSANVVDVYIGYLRRKLSPLYADGAGAEKAVLLSVRGKGYLFREE